MTSISSSTIIRYAEPVTLLYNLYVCLINVYIYIILTHTIDMNAPIYSNTSGIYSLFFSWLFSVENFTLGKLFGVFLSLLGVIIVSYGDSTSSTSNSSGSGGTGTGAGSDGGGGGGKQGESFVIQHSIGGDLFAATGAMLYGLFTTIVKIKVCYLYRILYYMSYTI